jgi:hypothetical protein
MSFEQAAECAATFFSGLKEGAEAEVTLAMADVSRRWVVVTG